MSLQVTPNALQELQRFAAEELFEGEVIRIVHQPRCGQRFALEVSEPNNFDQELVFEDVRLVTGKFMVETLENVLIDFGPDGFEFLSDQVSSC